MLQFWRSIFYSDLAAPIFKKAADIMGVTAQVCKEYCTSGMIEYGLRYFLLTLVVLGALIGLGYLAHIKCWLNPGNMEQRVYDVLAEQGWNIITNDPGEQPFYKNGKVESVITGDASEDDFADKIEEMQE